MTRRVLFLTVMMSATAAMTMAAVDPALLSLVMPDAKILTGIQVAQAGASPFGQYVLAKTQIDDPKLLALMALTGFDPRHDLREILAATSSASTDGALALARGNFQPAKFVSSAASSGGSSTQYRGFTVILPEAKGQGAIAFLDSTIAVIGNLPAVQSAIDRRFSHVAFSGPLADKAKAVSASNDAWFVTLTPLSDFLAGKAANPTVDSALQGNLLQTVQQASGGLTFGSTAVTLNGEALTRSAEDAQSLLAVLKFLVGMLQSDKNAAASIANGAQFSTDGPTLKLTLAVSEQQAEQLFMPAAGAKALRRKAAVR
jgi:hypothetical protein